MQADWGELCEACDRMAEGVEAARRTGCQLAANERDYRVALAAEELRLSDAGERATLIPDLARGVPEIAALKCARDCSEALYKASCEAVNVEKLKARVIAAQIERDWHSS